MITQKTTDRVGIVVGTKLVGTDQELIVSTDQGQIIRIKVSDISIIGRNTEGVRVIALDDKNESVSSLAAIDDEDKAGEVTH